MTRTRSSQSSRLKGRGWHGDPRRHAEAGRKGGKATARTHGESFYRKIGSKGGKVSPGNFRNNPERAREAGRKGGKARSRTRSASRRGRR